MVDICLISHLLWIDALEQNILPFAILNKYPNVSNWLTCVKNRSSVRNTMGDNFALHFISLLQEYNLLPQQNQVEE